MCDLIDFMCMEVMEQVYCQYQEVFDVECNVCIEVQCIICLKDEFFVMLLYEFCMLLIFIFGWMQLLMCNCGEGLDLQCVVDVIDCNVCVQVQFIDDLFDFNCIMVGKFRLDLQQVLLVDVVQVVVDFVVLFVVVKGVQVQILFDFGCVIVNGDSGWLQQVVWNLLSNVVKFMFVGGCVQVLFQCVNLYIDLSVVDIGIGILLVFLFYVFDCFFQQDGLVVCVYGGLGLGFVIFR